MATAPAVTTIGTIPDDTIKALGRLLMLPENWDSYGARPIDPQSVAGAVRLLLEVMQHDVPPPAVVPTNQGRVLLEWHGRGVDVEIEVVSPRRFHVAFEDPGRGIEWEREIGPDLSALADPMARLAD